MSDQGWPFSSHFTAQISSVRCKGYHSVYTPWKRGFLASKAWWHLMSEMHLHPVFLDPSAFSQRSYRAARAIAARKGIA